MDKEPDISAEYDAVKFHGQDTVGIRIVNQGDFPITPLQVAFVAAYETPQKLSESDAKRVLATPMFAPFVAPTHAVVPPARRAPAAHRDHFSAWASLANL